MLKHSGLRCLSGTVSLVPECVMSISDQSFLGVLMRFYISPFPGPVLLAAQYRNQCLSLLSNCDAVCKP